MLMSPGMSLHANKPCVTHIPSHAQILKQSCGVSKGRTNVCLAKGRSSKPFVCKAVVEAPAKEPTKKSKVSKSNAEFTPEEAADVYKDMKLGRDFEEMCAQMYYRGKMFGFVHLYSGQEAVSTGVIRHLKQDDYVCSTYRDHVHALSKNVPAREIMAELFGKKTGICRGQGGSMHMFSKKHGLLGGFAFIGEGIPIGLGAAFQIKYRKEALKDDTATQVACNFFGDGTANNGGLNDVILNTRQQIQTVTGQVASNFCKIEYGQFYECLNMASLYKLPCIFVVENNKWAIGMNHPRATGSTLGDDEPFIYKKGPAFGMPGVLVDGMDVRKVRQVAKEAIERARRGEGPTLIEAETYRFRGHSLADPDELRLKSEKEHYAARDPIPQFKKWVLEEGLLSEEQLKDLDKEVEAIVEESVQFADESPKPEKGQLLENVFADPKGFGVGPDGRYRYEQPGFSSGTAAVS